MTQAAFSFIGTEIVAICAAEVGDSGSLHMVWRLIRVEHHHRRKTREGTYPGQSSESTSVSCFSIFVEPLLLVRRGDCLSLSTLIDVTLQAFSSPRMILALLKEVEPLRGHHSSLRKYSFA